MQMFFDLIHFMNEKSQMLLKKQMEIFQDNLEEVFKSIKDLGECPLDAKDLMDKQNEFAQKNTARNMQHGTELGALYTQASSEIFRKYSDQMQHNMNNFKKSDHSDNESKTQKKDKTAITLKS